MRSKEAAGKYTYKSEVKAPGAVITKQKARTTERRLSAWDPQAVLQGDGRAGLTPALVVTEKAGAKQLPINAVRRKCRSGLGVFSLFSTWPFAFRNASEARLSRQVRRRENVAVWRAGTKQELR